jgi:protein-S-isoprenylcysteine O-methyltransferase Ste14
VAEDRPDIVAFPPLLALGAVIAAVVLGWLLPLHFLPPPAPVTVLPGLLLIVAALALVLWGDRAFKRAGTNVNPRRPALHLVETGPYRFTRNPMYLGMVVFLFGLGLAASLDWALILTPVLWAALHFGVVLREEAYLSAKFGAPYVAFLGRTRRWI